MAIFGSCPRRRIGIANEGAWRFIVAAIETPPISSVDLWPAR